MSRTDVRKTYKLYIGGAFPRSESGRTYLVNDASGRLLANAAKASAQFGLKPPRPEHWGGYRLVPDAIEFWQGRRSRLHDRLRYTREDGRWVRRRLAP